MTGTVGRTGKGGCWGKMGLAVCNGQIQQRACSFLSLNDASTRKRVKWKKNAGEEPK